MPFVLIAVGLLLIVVAFRGTQDQFFSLLKGDLTGSNNFFYWVVSILVVGAIGYIPKLKGVSDAFLVLIMLVLFISNKGFFSQFNAQLKTGTSGSVTLGTPTIPQSPVSPQVSPPSPPLKQGWIDGSWSNQLGTAIDNFGNQ